MCVKSQPLFELASYTLFMGFSIVPIGVNDAFSTGGFETNYLVQSPDTTMLVDCGTTASRALAKSGRSLIDIDSVYISHLHLDHTGGLVELGTKRYFGGKSRPRIYLHRDIYPDIWDCFLSGLMAHFVDTEGNGHVAGPDTFFEFVPVDFHFQGGEDSLDIADISLRLVKVDHMAGTPTHGLVVNDSVFITTDTTHQPQLLMQLSDKFGLRAIFHDCSFRKELEAIHCSYFQLLCLPQEIKDLLILTHYEDWGPEFSSIESTKTGVTLELGQTDNTYLY